MIAKISQSIAILLAAFIFGACQAASEPMVQRDDVEAYRVWATGLLEQTSVALESVVDAMAEIDRMENGAQDAAITYSNIRKHCAGARKKVTAFNTLKFPELTRAHRSKAKRAYAQIQGAGHNIVKACNAALDWVDSQRPKDAADATDATEKASTQITKSAEALTQLATDIAAKAS